MTHPWRLIILSGLILMGLLMTIGSTNASEFLLHGISPQKIFHNSSTAALAEAACEGLVSKIDALVKAGADVNGRGEKNITPLIWAMTCHNYKGIEALLAHGANPNQPMEYGQTPTWLAAGGSDPKILPLLLVHGGNPNYYCAECGGTTVLENAIDYQRTANMKLLIKHGANVNFHGHDEALNRTAMGGDSAMDSALAAGRYDYVVYLLLHGYHYKLQVLANELVTESDHIPKKFRIDINPAWRTRKYKQEALRILEKMGIHGHKIPSTIAPPPPGIKPLGGPPLTQKEFERQQEELDKLLRKKGLER